MYNFINRYLPLLLSVFIFLSLLTHCTNEALVTQPENEEELEINIPQILNIFNDFKFELTADSLTQTFIGNLFFLDDSLITELSIANKTSGRITLKLFDENDKLIIDDYLGRNIQQSIGYLFETKPDSIYLKFANFNGDFSFHLNVLPNTIQPDTSGIKITERTVYFCSFESNEEISCWESFSKISIRNDAPLGGGIQSAYVSGGCVGPHERIDLPPIDEDGYYIVQCWAKTTEGGGSINLGINGGMGQKSVSIRENNWSFYKSDEPLYCPAGSNLTINLISGGFGRSSMLIDLIQIIKVENTKK